MGFRVVRLPVARLPVTIQIAHATGLSPSKLLIPMSYQTVLGGMISLIGTSTNLLVDGAAHKAGLDHFGLFEIAPLGFAVVIVGGIYLATIGRHLLPERQSMASLLGDRKRMKYFTEVAIPEDSVLVGKALFDTMHGRRNEYPPAPDVPLL